MAISTGGGDDTPMSDINTTPLVDVMLVLLVIFMITAPLMTSSLKLDLPQIAENGLVVPVGIDIESPMTDGDYVKAVHVFADGNPLPVQVTDPALAGPWKQEASQPPLYYYVGAALTFWIDASDMEQIRWLNPHVDNGVMPPNLSPYSEGEILTI